MSPITAVERTGQLDHEGLPVVVVRRKDGSRDVLVQGPRRLGRPSPPFHRPVPGKARILHAWPNRRPTAWLVVEVGCPYLCGGPHVHGVPDPGEPLGWRAAHCALGDEYELVDPDDVLAAFRPGVATTTRTA